MSIEFTEIKVPGYKRVLKVTDSEHGLTAIISIHSLALGPTLGGIRIYPYKNFEEGLADALRLSKGMTYKSALAEVSLGGGKSVIFADAKKDKNEALLKAFGRAVEMLGGEYICAEDVGCTPSDVAIINKETKYVVGLEHEHSSGNPSPFTAWGTYRGIQAVLKKIYGDKSVRGRRIAIQGLGSVGAVIANYLFWQGAQLIVSDIDETKMHHFVHQFGAEFTPVDMITEVECDVFVPCALGGIINDETLPKLKCKAIAGCANNQLADDRHGKLLNEKGILYAPDFVINAGGLINVACEINPEGYDASVSRDQIDAIYDRLLKIFETAEQKGISSNEAAIMLAEYRVQNGIGVRTVAPQFHHTVSM